MDVRLTIHRSAHEIEVHGKRVLYSGDFRTHGRKSGLTTRLMAAPPENVDVLLMEGTNIGGDKLCITENSLEDAFVDLFRSTAGRAIQDRRK
jgi:ribonuclease J